MRIRLSTSTASTCGLPLLGFVQGCERFAFFAMLPRFVLYLHHRHGFTESSALLLLGLFQALSYFGAWPAGMLTDHKLRPVTATILGAALLTLGYGALAQDQPSLLWPALVLLVLGHSFFKSNISALVAGLLPSADAHRERGFLWQHLAVNIGAVAGPLCAEWFGAGDRWSGVFAWTTAAMLLGTFVLVAGEDLLGPCEPPKHIEPAATGLPNSSRERSHAVRLLCGLAVVFWLTAQQAGSSLALFAEMHTERNVMLLDRSISLGPGPFAALHAFLVLMFLPLFMAGMAWLRRRNSEPSTLAKMLWGYVITAGAFTVLTVACIHGGDTGRVSPVWLGGCYLLLSLAEILLAPLGLSLLTQITPPGQTAQAVGLWFAASAAGNGLAGVLGLLWGRWPNHRYFALLSLLSLGAATVLLARLRTLEMMTPRSRR